MMYRPFRNSDPPGLAEIWRSCAPRRGWTQPMSTGLLQTHVLAKPYFENAGLIVALDGDKPVGYVHAGFGPDTTGNDLAPSPGVINMLVIRSDYRNRGIGEELLRRGEAYLIERGSTESYAGGKPDLNPFYLGLYGGSESPGILDSDHETQAFFQTQGYEPAGQVHVLHADLARFRPMIDRQQIQLRRSTTVEMQSNPRARNWWDACIYGAYDRLRCEIRSRTDGSVKASVMAWHMDPVSASWGVRAAGVTNLQVEPGVRRQGLATFLLAELFRHLKDDGVTLVELQINEQNCPMLALSAKLGLQQVDRGLILRKEVCRTEAS